NSSDNKEKLQALSNTLIEQIDNLTDIATAFSDFADMPQSSKKMYDLEAIINTAVDIYKDYSNVEINLNIEKQVSVFVDKNQWLRVFNNLLKNSIQATITGKTLIISIGVVQKDNSVIITFADNGRGIQTDTRDKIFTPNFTTKTKGSGLGLAMVKNIVRNSDGTINFESEVGKGATFTIIINNG
ncbi:MAG: HAMP domain-containing histidine kinase, partial [Bacteroidales bacterium]|nr:HAMP domain-containing histidine kinase [Bacteroidales bacterium]